MNEITRRDTLRLGLTAAGLALIAVVSFTGFRILRAPASPRSLAILPFSNDAGDPSLDYLSEGLSEIVVDYIAQTAGPAGPAV